MVDLRNFWRREAAPLVKRGQARRLRQGRGVSGRALPRKKRPNGRPLGYGKSVSGLPGRLMRASVRVFLSGFDLISQGPKVGWFHRGYQPQNRPPRPIMGVTKRERAEILEKARETAARQINRAVRARGR